jgi:hypothetical protein
VAALSIAALTVIKSSDTSNGPERTVVAASGYPRWPAEALADWVGFADQVSVVTITAESQLPWQEEVKATGEGYVGRRVTARIDSTIWSRPQAPSADGSIDMVVDGWAVKNNELFPLVERGAHRIEVGERLVAALVQTPEGPWSLLSQSAAIPLGPNGRAARTQAAPPGTALATLDGKTTAQIATALMSARPTPVAARYQHVDVDARAKAVWDAMLVQPGGGG